MISRMSSAGRWSRNPRATSFDTPIAVPAMPSCVSRWNESHGASRRGLIPACGMSSKYDAHSAKVSTNWNASATTSTPLTVLSLTAMATFTNDSPHTMIVNAPRRSRRWCSSIGGNSGSRLERMIAGRITTARPTAASPMRAPSGNGAATTKHAAAIVFRVASCRAKGACGPPWCAARQYIAATVPTSNP